MRGGVNVGVYRKGVRWGPWEYQGTMGVFMVNCIGDFLRNIHIGMMMGE